MPMRWRCFSLFVHRRAPIWKEVEAGRFTVASELENLEEERRLLEQIETDGLDYDGLHDGIEVRIRGMLPRDREKMLHRLDAVIEENRGKPEVYSIVR